ncbi:Ribosome-recycling factor [Dirofilaria immitis]
MLRKTYMVLAVIFLNNGFTGISAMSLGIKRLIITVGGEEFINHHECVLNVPILILTAYLLDGLGLLINSIERLSIVAFPLYYYAHNKRINYSLIIAQYLIAFVAITSTVVASLIEPIRRISNFCLKFGVEFLSNHSYNRDLSHFLKNQKRYTQTSLISCCFTFFFVVVPTVLEDIFMMDNSTVSQIILTCCMFLQLLNSFNITVLFLYRQRDFRYAAIRSIKYLLYKRKQHVQPVVVVGFGK